MNHYRREFLNASKPHILMITNHGIHSWDIVPGLPDTGGQNVFVNQFTAALAKTGFRITIVNRGGYPHPTTGELRTGVSYKDHNQRILWLEDGYPEFVRKEDMDAQLDNLCDFLVGKLDEENTPVNLIISHYWDGAKLGILYNQKISNPVKHIWVPHSLGAVKKRNVKPEQWENLRIEERIANEKTIVQEIDYAAATSATIRKSLIEDYHFAHTPLFLPPCINPERYHPRELASDHYIWDFIAEHSSLTSTEIRSRIIITEISRTDTTKRKNILIQAFARMHQKYPKTLLVLTIDKIQKALADELLNMIKSFGITDNVVVLGSVWDELPDIYAATDIYCTPSIMEGFGMTPQEAAATSVPVISSDLVPFVVEYLLGTEVIDVPYGDEKTKTMQLGSGAIVVKADDILGFTSALEKLVADANLREKMGKNAYQITIPYFTWKKMVQVFLDTIKVNYSKP